MRYRFTILAVTLALLIIGCASKEVPPELTVDQLRAAGLAKLDAGDEPGARVMFETMITHSSTVAPEALYYIALSYYDQGLYEESYVRFEQIIDRYPASEWCDDAQLMMGECKLASVLPLDRDQTAVDEALNEFIMLIEEYENSPLVPDAQEGIEEARRLKAAKLLAIGKFYKKTGERRAAVVYFENISAEYPAFEHLDEVTFLTAECYGELGETEPASQNYRTLLTRFPESTYASAAASRLAALEP
jgi:outer membrane protein assembly factor BamD